MDNGSFDYDSKRKLKTACKHIGLKAHCEHRYGDAFANYTRALDIDPYDTDVLSVRAHAFIQLGCYNKGLQDIETALRYNSMHVHTCIGKVKCLWGLRRFEEALNFINGEIPKKLPEGESPNKADFLKICIDAPKMLDQSEGRFDMEEIMKLPRGKCHDFAEYTGPVKISEIPGKGRGLLATEDIIPGQLLICSKAFAIVFGDEAFEVDDDGRSALVVRILEKFKHESDLRKEFGKLYAGPDAEETEKARWVFEDIVYDINNVHWADVKLRQRMLLVEVEQRIIFNGCADKRSPESPAETNHCNYSGIWILPSYLNHSCVDSNASRLIHGDLIMIRAVKTIKAGEEITIPYVSPQEWNQEVGSLRHKCFELSQFTCDCRLCQLERNDPKETVLEIQRTLKSIEKDLEKVINKTGLQEQVARVRKLIDLRAEHPTLNIALTAPCVFRLCEQLETDEEWEIAAEFYEKAQAVCTDTSNVTDALTYGEYAIGCQLQLKNQNKIQELVKQLKKDFIATYGSIEPIKTICPITVKRLEDNGIDIFNDDNHGDLENANSHSEKF